MSLKFIIRVYKSFLRRLKPDSVSLLIIAQTGFTSRSSLFTKTYLPSIKYVLSRDRVFFI
jgi:hypothetical protein